MSSADSKLDAQLREVRLPDGLLDRLMALPLADDEDVDELLREVAVPPGLLKRLRAIALAEDDGLDEALRNVPVPDDLATSCRHHARRDLSRREGRNSMDRTVQIGRIVMAASLILAVTLSLGSAMLLTLVLAPAPQVVVAPPPRPVVPPAPVEPPLQTSWRVLADDLSGPRSAGSKAAGPVEPSLPAADHQREIEFAEVGPSAMPSLGDTAGSPVMPGGADPLTLWPGAVLVSPNSWDNLPEPLIRPTAPVPHGLDWPLEPPANRPFLQRWGFPSVRFAGCHPRLQTCPVPLAVDPSSYELARRYLERNEWPPADRVPHRGVPGGGGLQLPQAEGTRPWA